MDETHLLCDRTQPTTSIADDRPSATSIADDRSFFSPSMDDEHPHPGEQENESTKDAFLSLLCYENLSEKDDDINSISDWSAYEKDDDSDGVDNTERDVFYPSYDPTVDWRLTKPILGMKFESPTQLKESLIDYGVSNGYQLEFIVNDYRRLLVVCGKEETDDEADDTGKKKKVRKCPFRLWAKGKTNAG